MMMLRKPYINPLVVSLLWLAFILMSSFTLREVNASYVRYIAGRDSLTVAEASDSLAVLKTPEPVDLDSLLSTLTIPIVDSLCVLLDDANSLNPFFEELNKLRAGKDTVINIVHLGDSHIQAGYYSGRMMRLFHQAFGNAGRGWIAPFKLSKVNEPDDYFIASAVKEWTAGRVIQRTKRAPVGLGGIGIHSVSPSINLDVVIAPKNGFGYSFNKAILFRGDRAMPMLPAGSLKDSINSILADRVVAGIKTDTFQISCLSDTLLLHSTRRVQGTDSLAPASSFNNVYYGLNLMNGGSGVLYHSIGVNGSMYVNYTDDDYVRQLALLKPSLLIISLGTNETFGARFRSVEFSGQIRNFLSLVRKYIPETTILLTTPPECYKRVRKDGKRVYVRNANTEYAARSIKEIAQEEHIACWDLFAATGGKNSYSIWYSKKLMGRDRIHYNKDGYKDQGTLLFYALMQSYNSQFSVEERMPETETIKQ